MPMLIKVNGEEKTLADGLDINAIIAQYNLTPEKVAIELNRRLLRKDRYDTVLKQGDSIEIVTFVGGG
jgi:sulfur carrier protein